MGIVEREVTLLKSFLCVGKSIVLVIKGTLRLLKIDLALFVNILLSLEQLSKSCGI